MIGSLTVFAFALSLSCANAADPSPDLAAHSVGRWGIDLSDQDRSIRPGDDFYAYQNGAWLARTELGPERPMAAYWRDLRLLAPQRLTAILEQIATKSDVASDSPEAKAGAFYRAFMDEASIEVKGATPLAPELDAIRSARTPSQLAALMGQIEGPGAIRSLSAFGPPVQRGLFMVSIAQDQADPTRYSIYLGQGGLLLPGPEYYLEPQFADVRAAYRDYAAKLLAQIGWSDPQASARQILEFETRVASASWSHEQMQDAVKTYNPMTVRDLTALAPGFDWGSFLDGAGLGDREHVMVDAKDAFPKLAAVFAATAPNVLQARLAFAAADYAAPNLDAAMETPYLEFHGTTLGNGALLNRPRGLRAEQMAEACIGDILARFYIERYSSPEAKAKAQEMAALMRTALDERLQKLAWMSPASRAQARDKLAKMRINIGYPDRFDDFRGLDISDRDHYGNVRRATAYQWQRLIRHLDRPYDRSEWSLSPEYPNYNYVATTNTVEIPAALLQPPFFDGKADDAVNYGAIGSQIGQMMLGAFTSQGLAFDGDGKLHAWLAPDDVARLSTLGAKISAQYSAAEPLPGSHLKGELLLDEALGDIGGIQIALDAYHASLHGNPAPVLDGFSGDQRFFLGRAQMWRVKFPPAFVSRLIATGMNAPPYMRINGPLPNIDAWYEAFAVTPGDRMYIAPEDRARVW